MPLTYAELIPLFKEISEKGVLELEWKAKRKRPNVTIDATLSLISQAANDDAESANAQNPVAKQFEFDDELNSDDGGGETSFGAKRILTSGLAKPRAKPAPTSMNKILNDLKKQQLSANVSGTAANPSLNATSAEEPNDAAAAPAESDLAADVPSEGDKDDCNQATTIDDQQEIVQAQSTIAGTSQQSVAQEPPMTIAPVATEAVPAPPTLEGQSQSQMNVPSQLDLSNASTQSQRLETLDLSLTASQDCF